MSAFSHEPVLLGPIVDFAAGASRLLDCTLGGGGHARALLEHLPAATLTGIDQDAAARAAAGERLAPFARRTRLLCGRFSEVASDLAAAVAAGREPPFDFVLADFGVSSHQLDVASRGFSFRADGPLDMRMDPTRGETAAELIARLDASALADVLYELGEERRARPLARAIVADRPQTTAELAALVRRVLHVPRAAQRIDPATRTFMALRMAVNDELGEIRRLLDVLPALTRAGGRAALLSFHSLEDRLVKHRFVGAPAPCTCPPVWPACRCQPPPLWQARPKKAVVADAEECRRNPRARSAKLRLALRCDA